MHLDIDTGYNDMQSLLHIMFCCVICTKVYTIDILLASVDIQFFLIGHLIGWPRGGQNDVLSPGWGAMNSEVLNSGD